jgi:glycosyltransferase involved in cell wall biosynthesis
MLTNDPLLDYTVAIPAWGRGDYLREAVRSALAQNYPPNLRWEVVVNDDASDPPLSRYLQEFSGQVRYFRNERNLGFAGNFRRTVELARGRWVHVLHCDDLVDPDYAGKVWQVIQSAENLGFVHALTGPVRRPPWPLRLVGRLVLGPRVNPDTKLPFELFAAGLEGARRVLRHGVRITTLVVRRDLVLGMDGYREEFNGVADEEYVVRLALAAHSAFIPAPMVRYRLHADQLSRKIWLEPDFVEVYWRAHQANLEHLGSAVTEADEEAARRRVAGGAVSSAFAHLLAGQTEPARKILDRAKNLFPGIEQDRTCRLLALLLQKPLLLWGFRFGKRLKLV